jgi:hypothetical protein
MSDDVRPIPPPGAIFEQSEKAVDFVRKAVGIALDYTPETLPVLDHYLAQVPKDRAEIVELVSVAAGAYFGEVARRVLGGEWSGDDLVLPGGVSISPTGMAFEAIVHDDSEERGQIDLPPELREPVAEALADRQVAEDEFYSLCGRLELLQLVSDVVAGIRLGGLSRPADPE